MRGANVASEASDDYTLARIFEQGVKPVRGTLGAFDAGLYLVWVEGFVRHLCDIVEKGLDLLLDAVSIGEGRLQTVDWAGHVLWKMHSGPAIRRCAGKFRRGRSGLSCALPIVLSGLARRPMARSRLTAARFSIRCIRPCTAWKSAA